MAQQTYRQLVNKAILESGSTLSDIGTESSFTSPSDKMHTRFKTWVADACKEIQMENTEMEFSQKQASILINPRVYVEQEDGNAPTAGQLYIGQDTGVEYAQAVKIDNSTVDIDLLSGNWNTGSATAYVGLVATGNTTLGDFFKINELVDLYSGAFLDTADFVRIKGVGRYDLYSEITGLLSYNRSTFYLSVPGGHGNTVFNDASTTSTRITHVPWALWAERPDHFTKTIGAPQYFTEAPNGHIEFDTILDRPYILHFNYEAAPQILSGETDTLTFDLPEQLEDIIVWKAVMHYADHDNKNSIYMRAKKRYEWYLHRMIHAKSPEVTFNRSYFRGV